MSEARARISGHESFTPSKSITLARSYVEGLEKVRDRYERISADHMRLNHEAITLAAHVLTLHKVLDALLDYYDGSLPPTDKALAIGEEVLDNARATLNKVFSCPCGHASFEHDEEGCNYLQCRHVCA